MYNFRVLRSGISFKFRSFSTHLERLKESGFSETQANNIIQNIDEELHAFCTKFAERDILKKLSGNLEEKMGAASAFVSSTGPFQMTLHQNSSSPSTAISTSFPTAIDPSILEKEIKLTGQQLTDEVKQLQADYLLDINLESKRREESDSLLEEKLIAVTSYTEARISQLNGHLDRVSRQVLAAIGGFIGLLTCAFISYSFLGEEKKQQNNNNNID